MVSRSVLYGALLALRRPGFGRVLAEALGGAFPEQFRTRVFGSKSLSLLWG